VAGRHVQTPREKPVNGQPKRCQTHRICRYVFLFVSYIFTNHAGSRRPTTANEGQRRSTKAHSSQRRPTKANAGQRRPTQAHEVPQQPTTANEGQRSVFFSFLILYSYYYETVPTPPLACKYEPGVGLLTTTNHPPSPPPPPHHQQHLQDHHHQGSRRVSGPFFVILFTTTITGARDVSRAFSFFLFLLFYFIFHRGRDVSKLL